MRTQPLRLGPLARRRLESLARRDAEAARATAATSTASTTSPHRATPTIARLQARANTYARREEQRFLAVCRRELGEHRQLMQGLAEAASAYDSHLEELPAADRSPSRIAEGDGATFEQLRRLQRRISSWHRRSEELAAHIHARFVAARLRASRNFDRSDEMIAIYWGTYRMLAAPADGNAPSLQRSGWLTDGTQALELWNPTTWRGRTDDQT